MKTKNILIGVGFLVGGYFMIDYFSKKRTSNIDLGLKDFVEPKSVWNATDIRKSDIISKDIYLSLKDLKDKGALGSFYIPAKELDIQFDEADMKEMISNIDWSKIDLDKINSAK